MYVVRLHQEDCSYTHTSIEGHLADEVVTIPAASISVQPRVSVLSKVLEAHTVTVAGASVGVSLHPWHVRSSLARVGPDVLALLGAVIKTSHHLGVRSIAGTKQHIAM